MFTGIIDHCGRIQSIEVGETGSDHLKIWISSQFCDLALGESIAVDGACLTVSDLRDNQLSCELSPETLACTIAETYAVNTQVNLERALRMNDRLGGHFVTGHIDQTITVAHLQLSKNKFLAIDFVGVLESHQNYLIPKGCIAINGVSLTINAISRDKNAFSVMLIPHTMARTQLSALKIQQAVNVEFDLITKTVAHTQQNRYHDEHTRIHTY